MNTAENDKKLAFDMQQMMLEYVFNSGELYLKVSSILVPTYFSEPLNRVVAFVNTFFTAHHALPDLDLIHAKTGISFAKRDVPIAEFAFTASAIEEHVKLAAVALAFDESIEDFHKGKISGIQQRMATALAVGLKRELGIDQFQDVADRLRTMQTSIASRSIGIHALDIMLDNIRRGELVMFVAGTAAGKSLTLANVANWLAKDKLHVLILSLELSKELLAKRMDSIISGIASKSIFDNIEDVADILNSVKHKYGSLRIDKIPNGANAHVIRQYIIDYHVQRGHYPDVLVVDYLDLMRPIEYSGREGVFDRDKTATEELREVVIDFNMYGFTASQMNRDAVGVETVTHAHIAGGLSKLNTVDAAVAILAPTEKEEDTGERIFQQMKVRNGERYLKPVTLYLDSKTLQLTETPHGIGAAGIGREIRQRAMLGNASVLKTKLAEQSGTNQLVGASDIPSVKF